MVTSQADTDFRKLVSLCPVKKFSLVSTPAILASFDVIGLYKYVPQKGEIDIIKAFLNKRSNKLVSTEGLCRLAKIIK